MPTDLHPAATFPSQFLGVLKDYLAFLHLIIQYMLYVPNFMTSTQSASVVHMCYLIIEQQILKRRIMVIVFK